MLAELLFGRRKESRFMQSEGMTYADLFAGGRESEAGIRVGPSQALSYSPVWQAVSLISGDLAKLPVEIKRKSEFNGSFETPRREKLKSHPAYNACRHEANDEQTAFVFWRTLWLHCLIYSNGYARIIPNGRSVSFYPLLPDRTCAERLNMRSMIAAGIDEQTAQQLAGQIVYTSEVGGKLETYDKSEILHFKGVSSNGVDGIELLEKFRNAVAIGLAREKFESKFFKNGMRASGVLEIPATFQKKAKENLEIGWSKRQSTDDWFKVAILRDGAKFHQMSVSAREAQLVQGNEQAVRTVARFFNLHPSRLGLADSQGMGTVIESKQSYLDDTLSPWLDMAAAELRMKLFTDSEKREDLNYVEHNVNRLLRMNPAQRHSTYQTGIGNRYYSPNEVRSFEGLDPYDGGDEFLPMPGQFPIDSQSESDDLADDLAGDESRTARTGQAELTRLIYQIAQRARFKAAKPESLIQWVDAGWRSYREVFAGQVDNAAELWDSEIDPILRCVSGLLERCNGDEIGEQIDLAMREFELKASRDLLKGLENDEKTGE